MFIGFFFLFYFYPVIHSHILPVPILTFFYKCLGLKIGYGSYVAGHITDPLFVEIGEQCIVALEANIVPHVIEGDKITLKRIKIGDKVTIGVLSTVMLGSVIESNSIVGMYSLVKKHTHIGPNEVWAGVPARKLPVFKTKEVSQEA